MWPQISKIPWLRWHGEMAFRSCKVPAEFTFHQQKVHTHHYSLPCAATLSTQYVSGSIATLQTDTNSDPVRPQRQQQPLHLSLPKTVISIIQFSPLLTQKQKKPCVCCWQGLQMFGHHKLYFKCVTYNCQPTDGFLQAGNICFIYRPAEPPYGLYKLNGFWLKKKSNKIMNKLSCFKTIVLF